MRLFLHQLRAEQLIFWRSREAAVFVFVFPILLFLLLSAIYSGEDDGEPVVNVLLAGLLGYGVANTTFGGLAILLVLRRENGILKRLRSTPLPPLTYLAAAVASIVAVFALQTGVLVALAVLVFDADAPAHASALLLVLLLGAASFAALGFAAASLIRTGEGVSPAVNVVVLPMAFLSGGFGPARDLPAILAGVAEALPLKHFVVLVKAAALAGEPPWTHPAAVLVVALWGGAGALVAARRFRWQPRDEG
ncbi:MAG: ABC transporter permease [Thermoleophilia bacterium]|nr:ABC transporter permease [Thermoleophilia bacterium]